MIGGVDDGALIEVLLVLVGEEVGRSSVLRWDSESLIPAGSLVYCLTSKHL